MPDSDKTGKETILVVDDDQRNVRLLETILRSNGYLTSRACDGEEARSLVESERPDLILLDVMMPKVSGFELCQQLKERYETRLLPIIMITALNALEDKVRALELGADDFLSKPINKTELLAKVRSTLRVKALQDEVERQRDELEKTNERLMTMQRFKETMTQMVVHDLKNPLAGILGNIQLAQMQRPEMTAERREQLLGRSLEAGSQMNRMILNILEIAKLEEERMPLRFAPVPMHQVVREQMSEVSSLAARDEIRLECGVSNHLPLVRADRVLIGRVIANLLTNALKHTPPGGRVQLDARQEGGELVLTVADTGEGIPEDVLPHIFEKFVAGEADNARRMMYNSGLGLTFCRLAVEHHRGRIWLDSQSGEGTTVHVALPLETAAEAASDRPEGGIRAA